MTGAVECRYHGRDFTPGEMALLRALIAGPPPPTRHALSREFCRRVGWLKPDGGLKDMMARVTMLAMHKDGLIALPPPKWRQNRPGPIVFGPDTEPPLFPPPTTLDEVRPLDLRPVVRGTRAGKLWNEFVARHHYLGYKTLVGARMRYAVHDRDGGPIAMLGFSTAAWKLAPRDNFIGWTPQLREKNLPLVVDNPRFLIPPRIEIPNLGSHLLAIVRRRPPEDWTERYNTKPVLIETFVETPRYTGAVYRASGWVHVGTTRGRGRYDRQRQFDKPRKDIRLRPLRKTGNESSTGDTLHAVTGRPNAYIYTRDRHSYPSRFVPPSIGEPANRLQLPGRADIEPGAAKHLSRKAPFRGGVEVEFAGDIERSLGRGMEQRRVEDGYAGEHQVVVIISVAPNAVVDQREVGGFAMRGFRCQHQVASHRSEVSEPVERIVGPDVAVQHEERRWAEQGQGGLDAAAGVEQRFFPAVADDDPEIAPPSDALLYLRAEMMQIHDDVGDAGATKPADLVHDQRFPRDREQGFGYAIREWAQAFAPSGRENHRFHHLSAARRAAGTTTFPIQPPRSASSR